MKNKIIFYRHFLERNKIFFEILTAVVLTITSIFVSIQANDIANKANAISNAQTGIMELENTANLEIRKKQISNDSTETDNITKWSVLNNNSKISNFEIEKEFSYINIVKKLNNEEINIPLMEYINLDGRSTEQNEGLIYEFDNKNCSHNEYLMRQGIWEYGFTQIKSFIQVSFDNVLTKKVTKYYQIAPLIQEISKREWDLIKKDWSAKSSNVIHLKDIERNVQIIKNYH
ncbi:hypothetical protein [Flavobacterium hercynium]|uniref:Uncharacterized protein n=1 Tax=Flavobacterium hercynium TaxID=387094 RepID=A0A226HI80_9FLAO|nr:hypothetical protein [Flavobacterium hercynium]OXA93862.1 hypothetical protein B0A66_06360 [Flavobacterium hercynium]SMP20797.1 hypothetical protein SAMN06265346_106235 [Flavobacterium hercynium]